MHPALLRSSGWRYNDRLRQLFAAKWWGCPSPTFYDELGKHDRLDILAAYEAHWRIEAVNSYEAAKQAERDAKRKGKKK